MSSRSMRLARIFSDPGPPVPGRTTSYRGWLVGAVLALPGFAAMATSLLLPAADQGGVFTVAAWVFYAGAATVITGPMWVLVHAIWTRSLRRKPDDPFWLEDGSRRSGRGALPLAVGLVLVAANLAAAVVLGMLARHTGLAAVAAVLYVVAAATHGLITVARRTGQ